MADPVVTPPTPPENFWQKYQVIISGLVGAAALALQQFTGEATLDWKVIGLAVAIAIGGWLGNNLRGKGVSVAGLLGVAGYAFNTVATTGTIDYGKMILIFLIGFGALVAPPPKSAAYEQSPTIKDAKAEAKTIDDTKKP